MKRSSSNIRKILIFSQKKAFLIFREMQLLCILGNRNPLQNFLSCLKKTLFLYFGKPKHPKNVYISGGTSKVPKTKIFYNFPKKGYTIVFLKALSDNSFHLFYELNQTILLLYKNIESFFLS